jgi:hypothetical protein
MHRSPDIARRNPLVESRAVQPTKRMRRIRRAIDSERTVDAKCASATLKSEARLDRTFVAD